VEESGVTSRLADNRARIRWSGATPAAVRPIVEKHRPVYLTTVSSVKRFYLAVALKDDVEETFVLHGPSHGITKGGTLCGIPSEKLVPLETAFTPNEDAACALCVAEAQRREEPGVPDQRPQSGHAPAETWMAEWEPLMSRSWAGSLIRDERTRELLLALNAFWHLQESLPQLEDMFRDLDEGLIFLLPNASQIEILARLAIAEFLRGING
jgi:hypothetical protein